MNWLSYIFPQTVARLTSPYNRDIRVNLENGRYKLLVNGARESGTYIEGLWRYAFKRLDITSELAVKNILILGTAGGTVIHLLHALFPKAAITGVDIDPVMITIGKKYFALANIPSLKLVTADAQRFITLDGRYDLIVIDLFVGPDVPDFVVTSKFEQNVRKLLTKHGALLINYLRQPGYERKAEKLLDLLEQLYTEVATTDRYNNRFFCAKIG